MPPLSELTPDNRFANGQEIPPRHMVQRAQFIMPFKMPVALTEYPLLSISRDHFAQEQVIGLLIMRLGQQAVTTMRSEPLLILILGAPLNHAGRNSTGIWGVNRQGCRFSRPAPWMARGGGPRIQACVRAHRAQARCRVVGQERFAYFRAFRK